MLCTASDCVQVALEKTPPDSGVFRHRRSPTDLGRKIDFRRASQRSHEPQHDYLDQTAYLPSLRPSLICICRIISPVLALLALTCRTLGIRKLQVLSYLHWPARRNKEKRRKKRQSCRLVIRLTFLATYLLHLLAAATAASLRYKTELLIASIPFQTGSSTFQSLVSCHLLGSSSAPC